VKLNPPLHRPAPRLRPWTGDLPGAFELHGLDRLVHLECDFVRFGELVGMTRSVDTYGLNHWPGELYGSGERPGPTGRQPPHSAPSPCARAVAPCVRTPSAIGIQEPIPRLRRLQVSLTTARNRKAAAVGMNVMSAHHRRSRPEASKARSTRSGAGLAPSRLSVVVTHRRRV